MLGMSWFGDKSIVAPASTPEEGTPSSQRSDLGSDRPLSLPLNILRLRWRWLVGAFLIGLLIGGLSAGPSGYDATAIFTVSQPDGDSLRIKQLGQTLETTAASPVVVTEAARRSGVSSDDLSERLSVVWKEDSDVVDVTVRAANRQAAVRQANAVATAINTVAEQQSSDLVNQISRTGDNLLSSGTLANPRAEATRKSQVGSAIAAQQSNAVVSATSVQLVSPARDTETAGLSRTVGAALGGFALAVLGAAAAVALPFSRRRVRTVRELAGLFPGVRVRSAGSAAGEVAGLLTESNRRTLALVAMDDMGSAQEFGTRVRELLDVHGVPSASSSPAEREAPQPVAVGVVDGGLPPRGPVGRRDLGPDANDPVRVIVTGADEWSLDLLDGQAGVLAVVVAAAREHRVEELRQVTSRLQYADPTVILTS